VNRRTKNLKAVLGNERERERAERERRRVEREAAAAASMDVDGENKPVYNDDDLSCCTSSIPDSRSL